MGSDEGADGAAPPALTLPLHSTIRALQLKNGLRHGDYQRYRHYTTRRLRRLRRHVKATHHAKGRTLTIKPLTMEAVGGAEKLRLDHLMLALLNAERAWSFAMQIKQDGGGSLNAKHKSHLKRRMRKAAAWAKRLQELATMAPGRVCERSVLEVEAYCSWMGAVMEVEAEHWAPALQAFSTAHSILARLSEVGSLEEQDLLTSRAEEVAQSIRYCQYNLGQGSLEDTEALLERLRTDSEAAVPLGLVDKLEAVLASSRKEQASHLPSFHWGSTTIPITSQDIGVAVLKAQDAVKALEAHTDEKYYTQVYSAYDEAVREVGKELAALSSMTSGAKVEEKKAQLTALQSYLQHAKLSRMIDRNEALVTQLLSSPQSKPEDIVHVYDALLQNVRDILKLPGVDDADDVLTHTQGLVVSYRAQRSFHLAEFFATTQQLPESLVLYELAVSLCDQGLALLDDKHRLKQLDKTKALAAGGRYRVQALSLLQSLADQQGGDSDVTDLSSALGALSLSSSSSSASSVAPGTLLDRLDTYQPVSEGFGLPSLPPPLSLTGPKPQLFDLAMNQLRGLLPDLKDKAGSRSPEKQKAGGGFFGWLRG